MNFTVTCQAAGKPFSLANPVLSAPGGFGNIIEHLPYTDVTRLGAAIPNSLMLQGGAPSQANKFYAAPYGYLSSFGPNNLSLAAFLETVVPALPDDTKLILDLKARDMDDMERAAALAAACPKVIAVEVNLICPYGAPGAPYYTDAAKLTELISRVKAAAAGKPVIAKAPGGDFSMGYMAETLQKAGLDMFVAFNCINGCAIDIRTRTYRCGGGGGGGYFGPGIKPYALARLREAAAVFDIPVIGAGGITCAEDVLEYILAGAFAVQVGSAGLTRPDFFDRLLDDLDTLCRALGIESLDEIRGTAHIAHADLF